MTKTQIKELIKSAVNPHKLCGTYSKYDANNRYYFPLLVSDKLFLGAKEEDFILDGYHIRRFRDIKRAEIQDGKYLEILNAEGVLDSLETPDVDVTDWCSVFMSLSTMNINVIVESEDEDPEKSGFAIGKIEKVCKNKVCLKHFDADGIWQEELVELPYSEITSVTFGSRYVDIFSKYIGENL